MPLVGVDAEYHVALISRVFLAIAIMHQVAVRYDRLEGAAHLTRHLCSARHSRDRLLGRVQERVYDFDILLDVALTRIPSIALIIILVTLPNNLFRFLYECIATSTDDGDTLATAADIWQLMAREVLRGAATRLAARARVLDAPCPERSLQWLGLEHLGVSLYLKRHNRASSTMTLLL